MKRDAGTETPIPKGVSPWAHWKGTSAVSQNEKGTRGID